MSPPGQTAIGSWSGGRFLRFGEAIDEDRLVSLLRPGPDGGIDTVLTADAYGQGEADSVLGRALEGVDREGYSLVGAIGHDFYEGERDGPRGFPRFTDASLRGPDQYGPYLRMAAERSLERIGAERFDLLLLHNPDRTGYESEAVWDGMEALREAGLTELIGVAPGPANGFTPRPGLLLRAFRRADRLGDDHPQPARTLARRALPGGRRATGIEVITRVVDYGGVFWDDVAARGGAGAGRPPRLPPRGVARGGQGEARADSPDRRAGRADADPARLPVEPRPPGGRAAWCPP